QQEIISIVRAAGSASSINNYIIMNFSELGDNSLLSDCMDRIESEDPSAQSTMLDYFCIVGVGEPFVISRLNVLYHDENSSLYNYQVLRNIINKVGGQLDPIAFVDELISFKHQAYDSLWIDNHGIVNSLDAKLDNVKKHLNKGQTNQAINVLNAFLNEVEAQKDKHIKRKAYVFLRYNAEYLIEKLSE
ncbi:MAG: hypothetical protein ONB05_11840, partial [candidate division KSB1 bacterium]|nr:hypothetical protein [candidate division KSB1 bacterium]